MLKRIRIQNFKSLADVTLELDPLTVLIGRSGTGKSNFVEALRFLRNYVARQNNAVGELGHWGHIVNAMATPPVTLGFAATFNVKGVNGDYEYRLFFRAQNENLATMRLCEESLSLRGNMLFHTRDSKWVHKPKVTAPPQPDNVVLATLSGIQEVSIAYLYLTRGIGCYDFPNDVLKAESRADAQAVGLKDTAGNYRDVFGAIVSNLETLRNWNEIIAALRCLNSTIANVDLDRQDQQKVIVGHDVGGKLLALDLNQESEGLRRFLINLVALYQSPPKQTMLFEEPEKGIHPGAMNALADQFKSCADSGLGQVIMTTHSPQLLDLFDPTRIRVVEMQSFATRIGPVAPEQMTALREKLLSPGELLTVDQARGAPLAAPG